MEHRIRDRRADADRAVVADEGARRHGRVPDRRQASVARRAERDEELMRPDPAHESAAFIEIEACRIALARVYAQAVEAVHGRTAWACRTATLRRPRASSRRRGTRGTGQNGRCSIGSW